MLTHSRQPLKEDRWSVFAERLFYLAGGNDDRQTYTALKARVEDIERQFGLPGNRIFYLSIPPSSFTAVCEGLEIRNSPFVGTGRMPGSSSKNPSAAIFPPRNRSTP